MNENEHFYINAEGYIAELKTQIDALQAKLDMAKEGLKWVSHNSVDVYAKQSARATLAKLND